MIAILDIQHAGKRSSPRDVGATFDLDGDGVRGGLGEREIDVSASYVARARDVLPASGHVAYVLTTGDYGERHAAAIAIAKANPGVRCAYVACHANAGGGSYGLVEYDERSGLGAALAHALADALSALPGVGRGRTRGLGAADRGWACIDGIYAGPENLCGVIFEPFFVDFAGHRPLMSPSGLARVGAVLADGCLSWSRGRIEPSRNA